MNSSTTGNDIVATLRQSLALPPPKPSGGQATRRIITGSDGRPYVQFVDIATGQPITDLTGYEVLESGVGVPEGDWTSAILDQEARSVLGDLGPEVVNQIGADQPSQTEQAFRLRDGGEGSGATSRLTSGPRTARDNFGYLDTPKALEYGNMVPGPIGTLSKVANTAINANNVSAAQAARTHVGLPGLDKGQVAGGLVGTNDYDDGLVADAVINDRVYGIGLEALTPDGRTALTPEEARKRSETAPNRARLATDEENTQNRRQFQAENPSTGIKGVIQNAGKSLGRALGWSQAETEKTVHTSLKEVETTEYQGKPMGLQSDAPMPPSSLMGSSTSKGRRSGGLADVSPSFGAVDARASKPGEINWGSHDPRNLDPGIRGVLENASRQLGFGLNITSGYRDPARNKAVGGVDGSLHQQGKAVDISLKGLSDAQRTALVGTLQGIAKDTSVRVGAYSGNTGLHVDTGTIPNTYDDRYGPAYAMFDKSIRHVDQSPSWFKDGFQPLPDTRSIPTPTPRNTPAQTYAREPAFTPDQAPLQDAPVNAQDAIGQNFTGPMASRGRALGPQEYNRPQQYAALDPREFLGTQDLESVPAGMRNNNPGNLKYSGSDWQKTNLTGLVGPSVNTDQGDPQAVFSSPQAGMDSMARLAVGKFDEGMNTIESIIAGPKGWTPGATFAAENIAKTLGVDPKQELDLRDPATLGAFLGGLTLQEHGPASQAYTKDMYDRAVANTLYSPEEATEPSQFEGFKDSKIDRVGLSPLTSGFAGMPGSPRAQNQTNSLFDTPTATVSTGFASPTGSARSQNQNNAQYDRETASGFAGKAGSPRSMDESDPNYGSYSTPSSGFAGYQGSARSIEGRQDTMAEKGGRVGSQTSSDRVSGAFEATRSSGFAGNAGSARSQNAANDSYDGRSEGSGASRSSSGGFAGSAGSARSANQNNSSFDGSGSSSKGSGGFAGSAGSGRSANQGNDNYDGGSQRSSSGFAGSAGSARSVEGSQKGSSGGLNTDNAKGMSERSKDDGVGSGKSGSGTGSWR